MSETIINELESKRLKAKKSKYWANWCKVYLDGEVGNLEGACIPEWEQIDILPREARMVSAGLDFGYTNDPSSMICIYKYNEGYIFDEVFYKTQMRNSDIAKEIKLLNLPTDVYTYADQAEPKSIDELKYAGLRVEPCVKGRDSIVYGIELINQNKIYVTARSKNLIKELQGYVWAKDKEGNTLKQAYRCRPRNRCSTLWFSYPLRQSNARTIFCVLILIFFKKVLWFQKKLYICIS